MSNYTKELALKFCVKQQKNKQLTVEEKQDFDKLYQLLVDDKWQESYTFCNYQQLSGIEYVMPHKMWQLIINKGFN